MEIYIVRHGEAESNWTDAEDPGLSPEGIEQATSAADYLESRIGPQFTLYSSPLLRALQTASALATRSGMPINMVPAFQEIISPVPRSERQAWLNSVRNENWSAMPGVVRRWQQALLAELRTVQKPCVIFTHFMVLNAIVGHLKGDAKTVCFLPDNASITELLWQDGELELTRLGRQIETRIN